MGTEAACGAVSVLLGPVDGVDGSIICVLQKPLQKSGVMEYAKRSNSVLEIKAQKIVI